MRDGLPRQPCGGDLCLETIEDVIINTSELQPKVWKRYVDDGLCIIKRNAVNSFTQAAAYAIRGLSKTNWLKCTIYMVSSRLIEAAACVSYRLFSSYKWPYWGHLYEENKPRKRKIFLRSRISAIPMTTNTKARH